MSTPFHGIFSAFAQDANVAAEQTATPTNISFAEEVGEETDVPQATQGQAQQGQIAVDIYEHDHYYIVRAPIAGVRLSDLDIEVDGKTLTISGNRELSDDIPEDQYYVQECFWGAFSRSITLPASIDPKKVKATFSKDSILKVIIPKEEKVKIIRVNEA